MLTTVFKQAASSRSSLSHKDAIYDDFSSLDYKGIPIFKIRTCYEILKVVRIISHINLKAGREYLHTRSSGTFTEFWTTAIALHEFRIFYLFACKYTVVVIDLHSSGVF